MDAGYIVRYLFALSPKDGTEYKHPDNLPLEFSTMFSNIDFLGESPGRLTCGKREGRYLADKGKAVTTDGLAFYHIEELQTVAEREGLHFNLLRLVDQLE